jgi:hypothetical protein
MHPPCAAERGVVTFQRMNEAKLDKAARKGARAAGDRPLGDRLLGVVGTVLIVAGVGFALARMVAGEAPTEPVAARVAELRLLAPSEGETVGSPVGIVFESAAALTPGPMGWQAGGLHLHADLNGREAMPGPRDITRLEGGRYRWMLRAPPGELSLRLFWAGADHRPIEEGATPHIQVMVR